MTSFDAISSNYPQARPVNTPIVAQNPIPSSQASITPPRTFSTAEVSAARF